MKAKKKEWMTKKDESISDMKLNFLLGASPLFRSSQFQYNYGHWVCGIPSTVAKKERGVDWSEAC